MKRTLAVVLLALALVSCGPRPDETQTTGPNPNSAGTGVLTERNLDGMVLKFSAPERTKTGYAGLLIDLTDDAGKPVEGAVITAKSSMPEHGMDGPDMKSQPRKPGQYWMPGDDMMKGKWRIDMSVKTADGKSHTDSAEVLLP
jgi:hypothetical protein